MRSSTLSTRNPSLTLSSITSARNGNLAVLTPRHPYHRNTFGSDKVCRLSYANIQGRQALIDKFRNSAVMEKDASYRPMLFYTSGSKRGQEEPFPGPTMGGRRTSLDIALDDDEFMQPEYDMLDLGMRRWGDIPTVASKTERHLISNAAREDATSNAGHQPE